MCKVYEGCRKMYDTDQIMSVIDEVASAAASLGQGGAHSYDTFIKAREKCTNILDEYNSYISDVQNQVTKLLQVI